MSNSDKSENANLKKQNDKNSQELSHIKKDRETRIEEIEILNAEILDLKDQVRIRKSCDSSQNTVVFRSQKAFKLPQMTGEDIHHYRIV